MKTKPSTRRTIYDVFSGNTLFITEMKITGQNMATSSATTWK